MQYTVRDTPEIKQRIEADLEHVSEVVRRGDPWLRSLVLTGGFARGEGAVRRGVPENDYDFVAIRGIAPPNRTYDEMREQLERDIGIHIDLAPVSSWRLGWVGRSIFWYETALRGRVIWGDDLLGRLPIHRASSIDPEEGLRLLVNRAAGLLLSTHTEDGAKRLQAAKAILGALDVHLLAAGRFSPSQRERWVRWQDLRADEVPPRVLADVDPWLEWAFVRKTRPDKAERPDAAEAWRTAARLIVATVPVALRHAGIMSLDEYARHDHLADRIYFARHADEVPGAQRWVRHPTGQVRVATLRLLAASMDGRIPWEAANEHLDDLAGHRDTSLVPGGPAQVLEALRAATLQ